MLNTDSLNKTAKLELEDIRRNSEAVFQTIVHSLGGKPSFETLKLVRWMLEATARSKQPGKEISEQAAAMLIDSLREPITHSLTASDFLRLRSESWKRLV